MHTDAELLAQCRSQMSDEQIWAHQRAGELPPDDGGSYWPRLMADEPSEAQDRHSADTAERTLESLLPAWLLWVGVAASCALIAYALAH